MGIVATLAGLTERVVRTLGFLGIVVPGGRARGLRQRLRILGKVESILGLERCPEVFGFLEKRFEFRGILDGCREGTRVQILLQVRVCRSDFFHDLVIRTILPERAQSNRRHCGNRDHRESPVRIHFKTSSR